jgi:hypothetical protein
MDDFLGMLVTTAFAAFFTALFMLPYRAYKKRNEKKQSAEKQE